LRPTAKAAVASKPTVSGQFGGKNNVLFAAAWLRVARFLLVEHTKTGKLHIPNNHKICQMVTNYTYQMAVK
jgi:hypothetical protein